MPRADRKVMDDRFLAIAKLRNTWLAVGAWEDRIEEARIQIRHGNPDAALRVLAQIRPAEVKEEIEAVARFLKTF